jgi:hypothetical protein
MILLCVTIWWWFTFLYHGGHQLSSSSSFTGGCVCVNLRAVERDGFFWVVKCSFCLFVRDKGLMEQQPIITDGDSLVILSAAAAGPTSCSEKTVGSLRVCAFVDGSVISLDPNSCDKMPWD